MQFSLIVRDKGDAEAVAVNEQNSLHMYRICNDSGTLDCALTLIDSQSDWIRS